MNEFKKQCPIEITHSAHLLEFIKANIELFSKKDENKQRFECNLMIACTRILEYYNVDGNSRRRFNFRIDILPEIKLWEAYSKTQGYKEYQLYEFKDEYIKSKDFSRFLIGVKKTCSAGVSSADGKFVYIDKMYLSEDLIYLIFEIIKHELAHNIVRYFGNQSLRFISPEKNENLRIDGMMIEGGKYYDIQAGHTKINQQILYQQDPFTFQRKNQLRKQQY
ncbi:hypothetical protein pb186bvf_017316 [Paramecium bursaria]